jgi:hypothetical protein
MVSFCVFRHTNAHIKSLIKTTKIFCLRAAVIEKPWKSDYRAFPPPIGGNYGPVSAWRRHGRRSPVERAPLAWRLRAS